MHRARGALLSLAFVAAVVAAPVPLRAAESTTGTIAGTVTDTSGQPIPETIVVATAPSGRYESRADARGRFALLGLIPDTYTVVATRTGYESARQQNERVLPGETATIGFRLASALRSIGSVRAVSSAFAVGAPTDSFTVSGSAAQAHQPTTSSAGLANYTAGTVQGAIANVPGVDLDPFANAIVRSGKLSDAVFDYDSIPIPQGLIAEPGGNVIGAQLPTTGIGATTVTLAGYQNESDNALAGVVNQIPAIGTYPGHTTLELGQGLGSSFSYANLQVLGASPDLRWRYAFASTAGGETFLYGDGHSFYPSEAATYGLALQNRGEFSIESNVHYRLTSRDDVSVLGLVGQATYGQYGSPYPGETIGAFDGTGANGNVVPFPGYANQNAPVGFAAGIRGQYDILKAAWLHTGAHILSRVQLYQSQYSSQAGGPFWDENGFPDGSISLAESQGGRQTGLNYDGDAVYGPNHLRFGAEYRVSTSFLDQIVPTADELITSRPTIDSTLFYLADGWSATNRLDLMGAMRAVHAHFKPSDGDAYDVGALDPHFGASYRIGTGYAVKVNYDHITVPPAALEVDRTDSTNVDANGNLAPFVPLAPEVANDFTYSFEGGGRTQFRLSYYRKLEQNVIDVLPFNFRSAITAGLNPDGLGVPTNIGQLRASGFELWLHNSGFTFDANLDRAFSSSASQFAYNDLNAPAIAAGHLFPVGYQPNFTADIGYEIPLAHHRVRITPSLSYESGFPYGNGKMAWVFDPVTGKPEQVPNDNYVNPGANYYFLRDPAQPYDPVNNPYIGNLGTPEGNDPNTLHSPPQTLMNLHVEADVSKRVTLLFDVVNVFGTATPTAYQVNAYLIGPPGYKGGNAAYEAAYGQILGVPAYTLGNGIPTNDGVTQAVPWSYGTAGYIGQSYPLARTFQLRVRYRF
ncbi:MAG TPA: TonB-dependent receptor [Candidatus Elarobacter sp.]|nr:TonB-dependent receptor [Candidatus Elarobacter sp.]